MNIQPEFEALSTLFRCATFGDPKGQDEAYLKIHAALTAAREVCRVYQAVDGVVPEPFIAPLQALTRAIGDDR